MTEYVLVPHPDFPNPGIRSILVEAEMEGDGDLHIVYRVFGAMDEIAWPPPGLGGRADRLWEHSCLEAFIGPVGEIGYTELNLATSGQWAAYDFDSYREGMRPVESVVVALSVGFGPDMIDCEAYLSLRALSERQEWQLGLSAIIEAKDGSKSYWALKHPPGAPDFHNRDCFTARLAAPSRP